MNFKVLPLITTASLMLLSGCSSTPDSSNGTEQVITVEQMLTVASNQLNTTLPKMIDTETRLDTSYAKGNRFYYKSTLLNYYVDNIDVEVFNREMSQSTSRYICSSDDMAFFKENGVILVYSYHDDENKFISDVIVDTSACHLITGSDGPTNN